MLLYAAGSFFQVLEGTENAVDSLYARIDKDARHSRSTCIIREPIALRAFDSWSMGYAQISDAEVRAIVGKNDFFEQGTCLESLSPGRARKLLHAFSSGRWRTQIRADVVPPSPPDARAAN